MRLILTRHGETVENREGIVQGRLPGRLSKRGRKQVKLLAQRLKDEHIDAIFSSDLDRAAETAREIAKYHEGTPLIFTPDLQERSFGELEGKPGLEVDWHNPPEYFEPVEEIRERIRRILDYAYGHYPDGTVLFVAHGVLNTIAKHLILEGYENITIEHPSNTAVSIIEYREEMCSVECLNCTRHLA
jgi:probable phosphoglycerate mutase